MFVWHVKLLFRKVGRASTCWVAASNNEMDEEKQKSVSCFMCSLWQSLVVREAAGVIRATLERLTSPILSVFSHTEQSVGRQRLIAQGNGCLRGAYGCMPLVSSVTGSSERMMTYERGKLAE